MYSIDGIASIHLAKERNRFITYAEPIVIRINRSNSKKCKGKKMKLTKNIIKYASVITASVLMTSNALAVVNVGYFKEWAAPFQVAKVTKEYDEVLGEPVNWIEYINGTEMTQAMVEGDIDIAFSQGLAPFINAVNARVPIKLVGIAVAYGGNDDCIVRNDAGIDKTNANKLEGKSVAVTVNTMADFGFRLSMKSLGVDINKLKIVDLNPADSADLLVKGSVVMACGFGENSLSKMKSVGKSLLTLEEKKSAGINNIDIISVTEKFANDKPESLKRFMQVTAEANDNYDDDPDINIEAIAEDAGLTVEKAKAQMAGFAFPTVDEQLNCYLNEGDGRALAMLPFMGKLFATKDAPARDDYSKVVDVSFLAD